jgi:hypothetical protein
MKQRLKARLHLPVEIECLALEVSDNGTPNSDIGDRKFRPVEAPRSSYR